VVTRRWIAQYRGERASGCHGPPESPRGSRSHWPEPL